MNLQLTDLMAARGSRERAPALWSNIDHRLVLAILALVVLGVIMVGSASISIADRQTGDEFFFLKRQAFYALLGAGVMLVTVRIRLEAWERSGTALLALALFLLVAVLIPGIGRQVNGSTRWIPLGIFQMQVSEFIRFLVFLYLAGYAVRRGEALRTSSRGFLIPMAVLGVCSLLLLMEPDFGAAVVLASTGMAVLFLAGVPLWRFGLLVMLAGGAAGALVVGSPYRWQRLTGFINPWADPFDSGFQLTQSLIAIGRGEWFGVGLGGSIQKLFYLPEAHTDFVFAVLAEELGLVGVVVVVALFGYVVFSGLRIGIRAARAQRPFASFLSFAISIWLGLQASINMGVNMGLLPTKGLTLPLMSYGGSSLVATAFGLGLLLRADYEVRVAGVSARPVTKGAA